MLAGMSLAQAQNAAALQARHAALRRQLASNSFQRPIYLQSTESAGVLTGDIYARTETPYAVVSRALQGIDHWCDILILHLNVKSCRTSTPPAGETISVSIGRKFDQPLVKAYPVEFLYQVVAARPDYLQVTEVVPLGARRSFLHLSYSYAYGATARAAMQGYLATIGRNKVGFSVVGHEPGGEPVYIRSTRGVVERNTMRYYLAIEAYLDALSVPATERLEKRLSNWYAGIERYPAQLHELERGEYLAMKRKEVQRQQTGQP
jgi:hypothetical protein